MSDIDIESATLRLERTFDAPPEAVFDAWTNPEVLRRWWASDPRWRTPVAEVDLRVGGGYRLSMEDPADGSRHTVCGEYREVRRPERLVYSWRWVQGGGQAGPASIVTVDFIGDGARTTVMLEHSDLGSRDSREKHRAGWDACLGSLQARIFTSSTEQT